MKKNLLKILFILVSTLTLAKNIPPTSNRLVNDYVGLLTLSEAQTLERKLRFYNDSTSTQIVVVIEKSLENDDLFDYTMRLSEGWGIGQKGKNNGVLIYVALDERKIRINVGYGLEATITDAQSKRIIENILKPAFRQNQYYYGLNLAIEEMIALAKGEYKEDGTAKSKSNNYGLLIFILILLIIFIISSKDGGKNYGSGRRSSGGDILTGMLIGSMLGGGRRSSYGDFSRGSGSFGGFGGGSFGGGGSSGSW